MDMKNLYLALSEISERSIHTFREKKTDVINSTSVKFKCYDTEREFEERVSFDI